MPPPVGPQSPLIALVDSQLDPAHPDLGPNITSLSGQPLTDLHGTATAEVAAAPANGVGTLGVWPGARALNVPLPPVIRCSDSARGIAASLAAGAAVINMSYGSDAYCRAEHEELQRAVRAGVVAVAAAGNEFADGNPLEYPATLPHVLTVAATARDDRATGFSSASAAVDLSAPGIGIVTGVAAAFDADGTPDGYAALDGTSFSAPMVAAAVAWVRAARPELSPYQAAQVVRLGARDVGAAGWDADTGFGVLTLAGALARSAPQNDLAEPNDEFELVNGRAFGRPVPLVFSGARRSLTAVLDRFEDPADLYRIRIPARTRVRVTCRADLRRSRPLPLRPARDALLPGPLRDRALGAPWRGPGGGAARPQPQPAGADGLRRGGHPAGRPHPRRGLPAHDPAALAAWPTGSWCAYCASARSPVPSSASGVGTCGLSRRYHSASSAA